MENFSIALRVWVGTLALNMLFLGAYASMAGLLEFIYLVFIGLFVAVLISAPLLWPLAGLIKISGRLPYRSPARCAWLVYIISLQNLVFLQAFCWLFDIGWCFENADCMLLFLGITVSLTITLYRLKGKIARLYITQTK